MNIDRYFYMRPFFEQLTACLVGVCNVNVVVKFQTFNWPGLKNKLTALPFRSW